MQGWLKIYRKITEWGWYTDGNTMRVFLHILLTANIEDRKFLGYTIKRGQVVTSIPKLSAALNLTTKEIRTALDHLQNTNEIGRQTTNKFTIITICKYDNYQLCENENETKTADKGQTNGSQTADKGQQYKNIIIKEYNNNPLPTREEILKYAEEKQINADDALSFFLHYDGINWQDGNGNKITNWRSRLELWARDNRLKRQVKQTNNGGGLYRNSTAEEWERTKNKL